MIILPEKVDNKVKKLLPNTKETNYHLLKHFLQ